MASIVSCWFVIPLLLGTNSLINGQCTWNLNTDLPVESPVYFVAGSGSNLIVPTSNGMYLPTNGQMTLVCPGSTNTVMGTGNREITVKCNGQNQLLYLNQLYNLNNFYCTNNPSTSIVLTKQVCNITGELMLAGYNSSTGFGTLVTTCYDKTKETVLYSTDTLYGQALPAAQIDNNRPAFRTTGLTYGTTTANSYKQTEQLIRFTQLLGATRANAIINSTSYLARGHIAPDGDYLFATWASTTYYLVNAAPQWQNINAGNWLKIESAARETATRLQQNLTSMTGVYGVLQLTNGNSQLTDIYLMNNGLLRVPKWFWKVIYSPTTNKGIAFVTSNNPFLTSINSNELLCPNICSQVSFHDPSFGTFSKGYTYCCDVNVLFSAIGLTPPPFSPTGCITGV